MKEAKAEVMGEKPDGFVQGECTVNFNSYQLIYSSAFLLSL